MKKLQRPGDLIQRPGMKRRQFLGYVAATASVVSIAAACNKDDDNNGGGNGIDLGSGDVGILNYAYALEQLEAAFYTQVITTQFSGITNTEISLLTDIRDHEIAHREFFKAALAGSAIPGLEVDFSSINFSDRASVLGTAKVFEDLGVSAYNGAGQLIVDPGYLLLAGKIVSVEARHAAYVRDLLTYGSFVASDVVDTNGLDQAKQPPVVLASASPFLKSKLDASHLPTI